MDKRKMAMAVAAGLSLGALGVAGGSAHADGVTQISGKAVYDGNSEEPGNCDELESSLTLELVEGDLIGCWYTTDSSFTATPSGVINERGTETFIGKWNGTPVTFDTTYKFTGKFDADFNEIHGRCQHPIVGGDVEGRVDFKDDVETGEFYYRGHLRPTD